MANEHPYTWGLEGSSAVDIDTSGRIVDYIDPTRTRPATPEERVRQAYARILVEEYGYPKDRIAIERAIVIGVETKSADIVVYDSLDACQQRDQGHIYLIIETKAPTKTEGRKQLTSYIFASSAEGGVWTNGMDVAYFRRIRNGKQQLDEWTNIPRYGETWDTVGHYRKDQLKPPANLKQVFRRCHNAIYKAGLDSEDVTLDMVRIILAKYRDEQNEGEICEFRCTPDEFSSAEGRRRVADRIHHLFKQVLTEYQAVFDEGEHITIGDDNLAVVVNELQPFRFLADRETEQVYDVIGTAFEVYVATHLKGDRGQYFTNRLVIDMMVRMLNPSEDDVVLDPACGSGGFLVSALRHVRHRVLDSQRSDMAKGREIRAFQQKLLGIDVSPKLVRVAKTNMVLNGDGHGGIIQANTLRDLAKEMEVSYPLHPQSTAPRQPTQIFTNPPFGAGRELRQRSVDVLGNFALGRIWKPGSGDWLTKTGHLDTGSGVPPEILFLERCIQLLDPGGKLGIVIARGVLDNTNTLAARQYVLRHTKLLGVVNCHPNTFAPFNGTKASILFLEKKAMPGFQQDEDYPVFMAMSQKVGQDSMGRETYQRDGNGDLVLVDGRPVLDHDLKEIASAWQQHLVGAEIDYEAAWSVPLSRIMRSGMRFNPLRYAPSAEQALGHVLELADTDEWSVERLGDFATVFNGPRFRRPFAKEGETDGVTIRLMYTPKAFFERRGESIKYLDLALANPTQKRQVDTLTLQPGWILIVDSGTAGKLLGRVGMTTEEHDGTIGNNNMIRVIITDPIRRDYVYRFLRSDLGQKLILRNVYGTNQDHVEPDDVKNIAIPIPRDRRRLEAIHRTVREVAKLNYQARALDEKADADLKSILQDALSTT